MILIPVELHYSTSIMQRGNSPNTMGRTAEFVQDTWASRNILGEPAGKQTEELPSSGSNSDDGTATLLSLEERRRLERQVGKRTGDSSPKTKDNKLLRNPRRKSSADGHTGSRSRDAALAEGRRARAASESFADAEHDDARSASLIKRSSFEGAYQSPLALRSISSSSRHSAPARSSNSRGPIARRGRFSATVEEEDGVSLTKPDALSFLDEDSPEITEERVQQVIIEASDRWSPRSVSSSSSSTGSTSQRSAADTDATSPEQSINGDVAPPTHDQIDQVLTAPNVEVEHRYGTPKMARGPAKHPHIPPTELQPRISAPGQGHAKHLPWAEKLPMSGYELLADKLSSSRGSRSRRRSWGRVFPPEEREPIIKPIYRRFEALNHRLLLHLQDELSELEEQLHRLDTADTQTRRLANCILPASRRAEVMAGGELQWHKADILGKIGFKLGQYSTDHLISQNFWM